MEKKSKSTEILEFIKAHGWNISSEEAGDLFAMFKAMNEEETPLLLVDKHKMFMTATQEELYSAFLSVLSSDSGDPAIKSLKDVIMGIAGHIIAMSEKPIEAFEHFSNYVLVDLVGRFKGHEIGRVEIAAKKVGGDAPVPAQEGRKSHKKILS
jgi:hypothetical protein